MPSIFPTSPSEWTALLAALVPLAVWAGSSAVNAYEGWQKRRAAEWARLQELALILYNPNHQYGRWAQTLALEEMIELSRRLPQAERVLREALGFWLRSAQSDGTAKDLVDRLQRELNDLGRP